MSRLIDADDLIKAFEINKTFYRRAKEEMLIKPNELHHQMDFAEYLQAVSE
jgi:hypothetical protein